MWDICRVLNAEASEFVEYMLFILKVQRLISIFRQVMLLLGLYEALFSNKGPVALQLGSKSSFQIEKLCCFSHVLVRLQVLPGLRFILLLDCF